MLLPSGLARGWAPHTCSAAPSVVQEVRAAKRFTSKVRCWSKLKHWYGRAQSAQTPSPQMKETWWMLSWSEPHVVLPRAGVQPAQPGQICSEVKPPQTPPRCTLGPRRCFDLHVHPYRAVLPASVETEHHWLNKETGVLMYVLIAGFTATGWRQKKRRKKIRLRHRNLLVYL